MCWCVDWIRLLQAVIPSGAWGGGESAARGDSLRHFWLSLFPKTDLLNWSRRRGLAGCDFLQPSKTMCGEAHAALVAAVVEQWSGGPAGLAHVLHLCASKPAPCQSSQPVRNNPNPDSWFFSQSIHTVISWGWPHDQAGKTIMQHLLCQCLLSTKKAVAHSCTQQRGRAQEVLELIYSLLSGWAQLTNTPYVHYVPLNSGCFPALQWNTMCTFLSLKCRRL